MIPCCSVLQCVAVCCSVLQCVELCFSVYQDTHLACHIGGFHHDTLLQCVAVCCSMLQYVAVRCIVFQCVSRYTSRVSYSPNPIHDLSSLSGSQISGNYVAYRLIQKFESCVEEQTLQDLILRTRLCGTGFITQYG